MQIQLACPAALPHKAVLLVEVDRGKIIDAHPQVEFPNDVGVPGPLKEIGQHPTAYPPVPVLAQDRHPKLATMLNARPLLRAEGQRPDDVALNFGKQIEAGWRVESLLEQHPLLLQADAKLTGAKGQILALARHLFEVSEHLLCIFG